MAVYRGGATLVRRSNDALVAFSDLLERVPSGVDAIVPLFMGNDIYEARCDEGLETDGPRMLKPSNSTFLDPKTSNSKLRIQKHRIRKFQHHNGMSLDRKSFVFVVFPFPNLQTRGLSQIETFSIQRHGPRTLKV